MAAVDGQEDVWRRESGGGVVTGVPPLRGILPSCAAPQACEPPYGHSEQSAPRVRASAGASKPGTS